MKRIIILIFFIIFFVLLFYVYKLSTYTYISAKFKELRPMEENIPVYYKGIIIGRAREKRHSDTFEHTIIKIVLYPKKLLLPENTTILLKKEKREDKERDFLELIYPKEPSNKMLSNGSVIEGEATVDVDTFMANQKQNELEEIKQNLAESAQNLNYALEGLGQIFETLDGILKENQKNIYQTTGNVRKMTNKVNNSIEQEKLSNVLLSFERSGQNIQNITQNLNTNTASTMNNIEGITDNVNSITCGIRKTLRKKFGTLRLFFGQVIDECN